jgi:regulator of replication initiation timing
MMTAPAVDSRASVAGFGKSAKGVTPPSGTDRHGVFLTDVIVELGFARKEQVDAVVEAARTSAKPVEKLLLESGIVDESQLSTAIAERNGLDHVDLEKFDVDVSAAAMITRSVGLRYGAIPIAFASDGALIVAVEDPFDSLAIRDIEVMTRSVVRPAIATPTAIHELIERLTEETSAGRAPSDAGSQTSGAESQPELQIIDGEAAAPKEAAVVEQDAEEPVADDSHDPESDGQAPEAEAPEIEGKHFEQLGAVLAQRAVPDPEPEEEQALEAPSIEASASSETEGKPEPPAVAGGEKDLQRAGKRAARLESELLVARKQISDLKKQTTDAAPQSPELELRSSELERQASELERQKSELEQQASDLEQRITELEAQKSDFEQQNARLELRVTELEQRLGEVVAAAEEATAMTAKLDSLRRATEKVAADSG